MKDPWIIYGTAWKGEATARFVEQAVRAGFRGIDTANQPRHYQESLVGQALARLAGEGISRDLLFLQTKFTPLNGHGAEIPYDPTADVATQVRQSFESSLQHLQTDFVDSYLLHGPSSFPGLGPEDWQAWSQMEEICRSGRAKRIGISNVNPLQLSQLLQAAKVRPMAVQNRCFAQSGWDREVRKICQGTGMVYQGFSLLTANPFVVQDPAVRSLAERLKVTPEQIVFRFAAQLGMVPLTGTTSVPHMKQDLAVPSLDLSSEDAARLESIAAG